MFFTALSLILLAVLLLRDYAKDKGAHTPAKVLHALALAFMVLLGAASFGVVASLVQHFTAFAQHYAQPAGLVPGPVNIAAAFLAPVFDMILFAAAFAATQRSAIAISVIRVVLLASIPTFLIAMNRSFLVTADVPYYMVIAVIALVAIKLALFFLYGTRRMKAFLGAGAGLAP